MPWGRDLAVVTTTTISRLDLDLGGAERRGGRGRRRGRAGRVRRHRYRGRVREGDRGCTGEGARGHHLHRRTGRGGSARPPSMRHRRTSPHCGSSLSLRGAQRGRRGEVEEGPNLRVPPADLRMAGRERGGGSGGEG